MELFSWCVEESTKLASCCDTEKNILKIQNNSEHNTGKGSSTGKFWTDISIRPICIQICIFFFDTGSTMFTSKKDGYFYGQLLQVSPNYIFTEHLLAMGEASLVYRCYLHSLWKCEKKMYYILHSTVNCVSLTKCLQNISAK